MALKCGAICDDTLVARLVASEPELVARCVCCTLLAAPRPPDARAYTWTAQVRADAAGELH